MTDVPETPPAPVLSADPPGRRRTGLFRRIAGLTAVAAFVALLAYGLVAKAPDTTILDALSRGEAPAAPGFSLDVLTGGAPGPLAQRWTRAAADGRTSLAELRGTPVVLNFWASWCVPCREEAAVLERGWQRARGRGVLFVGLDTQDVRDDALDFVGRFGQTFPHVKDPSNATARRWGLTGIPETFFISREGTVVGHVIGVVSPRQLADGVAAAVAGRPQAPQAGGDQRPTR